MTTAERQSNLRRLQSLVIAFETPEIVLLFHITTAESLIHFVSSKNSEIEKAKTAV